MKLGLIGLGRMGYHMAERLLLHKHMVVAYNRSPEKVDEIAKKGIALIDTDKGVKWKKT